MREKELTAMKKLVVTFLLFYSTSSWAPVRAATTGESVVIGLLLIVLFFLVTAAITGGVAAIYNHFTSSEKGFKLAVIVTIVLTILFSIGVMSIALEI